MSAPPVSVVVCTYSEQRWSDLVAAVESIRRQGVPGAETIVAVDHNAALEARVRREIERVVTVRSDGAPGLSATRNAGIAAARGAVVAFMDDDCVADPTWLARLLGHFGAAADVAAAGGAVAPRWDGARPRWFPQEFDWVVGCSYRGLPAETSAVRNLIGANMAFRREALDAVGGFRDGLGRIGRVPLGCEETELCLRIHERLALARIVYDPAAVVHHRVPEARGRWRYFAARCWAEGLSKAAVARLAGRRRALASERAHALRTLPIGVLQGMREAAAGDLAGARRAAAIVAGLAITTSGYARGTLARRPGA